MSVQTDEASELTELRAKLRTADRDGAAGALEEVARIVAQLRAR